jgi:1,4-alpha-glucan branching enzyme
MGIAKRYLKTKPICKAKFTLPREAAAFARRANIVGDFNDWDANATRMKKLKDGSFTIVLDLPQGREYQYRYLIDGTRWENDWNADKYVRSPLGDCDNSVVVVEAVEGVVREVVKV